MGAVGLGSWQLQTGRQSSARGPCVSYGPAHPYRLYSKRLDRPLTESEVMPRTRWATDEQRGVPRTLLPGAELRVPLHLNMHMSRARHDMLASQSGSCRGMELQRKLDLGP